MNTSSGIFDLVNFENISHIFLVFSLVIWVSKCQLEGAKLNEITNLIHEVFFATDAYLYYFTAYY